MISLRRPAAALLLASAGTWLFATRVYLDIDAVRIRVLRQPAPATDGRVELQAASERFSSLPAPVALVARVRNLSPVPGELTFYVDGKRVCAVTVPANAGRRIDCDVVRDWTVQLGHAVSVRGPPTPWTVEYLELATHHGHSTGILQGFVLPAESRHFRRPDAIWLASVWAALALLFLIQPQRFGSRAARLLYAAVLAASTALVVIVLLAPRVSPYLVVISPTAFAAIALLTTLSRTWPAITDCAPLVGAASLAWTWCSLHRWWLVWTMAAAVTGVTGLFGARAVGGADEYGYASEAELWLKGRLTIEQPFVTQAPWPWADRVFAPLGYRPHYADPGVIVPTYAPGLPMLLAAAKILGGQEAMFWVVPLSAGLLVLGTYAVGRRLGVQAAALVAAALVATSPLVLFMSTALMTDVPIAAAWVWAFYLLIGTSLRSAAGAGLLSALAVLIRPNLVPLAGVLALHYLLAMRHRERRRRALGQLLVFSITVLPGAIAVGVINAHLYGSPLSSGYGHSSELFAWSRVPTNLRLYLRWFAEAHTPFALCGLVALLVPLRRLWPDVRDRSVFLVVAAFVLGVWGIYCAWLVFEEWWFSRFLLSSWPFIMLGVGSVAVALYRPCGRDGRALVVVSVIALCLFQLDFALDRQSFAARQDRGRFVATARLVSRVTEPGSVIASLDHSGSIRYYGGRMTMRFEAIPTGSIDTVVEWLSAHGVRTYLAVEEWELEQVRQVFAGSQSLRALDKPPIAVYEWKGKMRLFDLTEPDRLGRTTIVESNAAIGATAEPVALPGLVFTKAP